MPSVVQPRTTTSGMFCMNRETMPKPWNGFRMLSIRILILTLQKELVRCWRSCHRRIRVIETHLRHLCRLIRQRRPSQPVQNRQPSINSSPRPLLFLWFVHRLLGTIRRLVPPCHSWRPKPACGRRQKHQQCCRRSIRSRLSLEWPVGQFNSQPAARPRIRSRPCLIRHQMNRLVSRQALAPLLCRNGGRQVIRHR